MSSHLLIDEPALQVLPSLATAIGLNEAIALQQIHFKTRYSKYIYEDRKWVKLTYAEWREQDFPFWSERTIARVFENLETRGFIDVTTRFTRNKLDQTCWYAVNYETLSKLKYSSGQVVSMDHDKVSDSDHDKVSVSKRKEKTKEKSLAVAPQSTNWFDTGKYGDEA